MYRELHPDRGCTPRALARDVQLPGGMEFPVHRDIISVLCVMVLSYSLAKVVHPDMNIHSVMYNKRHPSTFL